MKKPIDIQAQLIEISLTDIDFGIRRRQELGDLETLAQEIKDYGLIHPVTLVDKSRANPEDLKKIESDKSKPFLLLAGGRRFTAFEKFELSQSIPAYVYPRVLNYYEIRKIELIENTGRKGLTWQEEAVMTGELHELEQKIHGKSHTSAAGGHGLKETAEMLGKSKSSVKNEVDLAKALRILPELADIKNKTEALKLMREMRKTDTAERKARRAKNELAIKGEGGVKSELMNSYVCGDFFKHAEKLPDNTFDLIEIDPPYAIDLKNAKKNSKHTTTHYNEVAAEEYEAFMRRTFLYSKELLKSNGWLVCWYAIHPWHSLIVKLLHETGFNFVELPALWIKPGGQTQRPMERFASCYEPFIYVRKGTSGKLNKPGQRNYLVHPPIPPEQKFHPTHRPISLMEDVIERFIPEGKVLVPFAGSGVTLRAAHNKGCKAIGYDLSQDSKNKHDAYIGEHDITKKFEV